MSVNVQPRKEPSETTQIETTRRTNENPDRRFDRLFDMCKHLTTVCLATFGVLLSVSPHLIQEGMQRKALANSLFSVALTGIVCVGAMIHVACRPKPSISWTSAVVGFCWFFYVVSIGMFVLKLPSEYLNLLR